MSAFSEAKLPSSFFNEVDSISESVIILRSNVKNIEDCNKWVKEFGILTNTKWNARSSHPSGQKFICSKKFVCHHSAFMKVSLAANKRSISKNSSCLATINIKVKLNTAVTRRNDSFVKKGLPAVITINDVHNHSLNATESLKFLPASDSKEKFIEYFNDGMSIMEACKYHEDLLQLEECTEEDMANSRINPPYRSVQYWYDQWHFENWDSRIGQGLIEKLKEKSKVYEDNGITIRFSEEPFAVVIVTPIMKRAHNLKSSGQIVFVDSASLCDPNNHSITFMLCACSAGAVPMAVIIRKGQTEDSYKKGLQLLNEALEKPFNGKGYPAVFMTDDSEAEINTLKNVWPESKNLLSVFHVARAVWKWLWDSNHQILIEHRSVLMQNFQCILYAGTIQEAEEAYKNVHGYVGSYLPTYENWNEYLQMYWKRKELWCLAFRNEEVKRISISSFSEMCMRVFKDEVLCHIKTYSVLTILDFVATHLEKHYTKKFREFANNECANSRLFLLSLKKKAFTITKDAIKMQSESTFSVISESNWFIVNIKSGCCSCLVGLFGHFCKHQYSILQHYDIATSNFPPVKPQDKHEVSVLALGEKAPPKQSFEPLLLEITGIYSIKDLISAPSQDIAILPDFPDYKDCESTSYEEKRQNLLNDIFNEISQKDEIYKSTLSGLSKFLSELKNVKSSGSWETFLHTAGSSIPSSHKNGDIIQVPTCAPLSKKIKIS